MSQSDNTSHYVIILNPAAGRGQGRSCRAKLEELVRQHVAALPDAAAMHWEIVETRASGDGTRLAAQAVERGATVVVAAGGDGTLGEVVNGVMGSGAMLGLLPVGTGNDFARNVGLHNDMERAVQTLFHGTPQPIDVGRVHDRWFVNVAGCGFDALVAERVNRGFRYLHGTSAYLAAVMQTLLKLRPAEMRLTLDGESHDVRGLLCAVANASMYGGGMKIAPNARIDDGWLDVCLIADAGRLEFLRAFPRVFAGTHLTHPKVSLFRARTVSIESDPALPLLADGEVIGTTPAEFTLAAGAMPLLLPSDK
jgi:diacylglycerol kinase (ATP)